MIVWLDEEGDVVWREDDRVPAQDDDWQNFLADRARPRRPDLFNPRWGEWMVLE